VAIVVMVFLQSWRAMILPLIAVPVAWSARFSVMNPWGFSLTTSLFGLVLAIVIVRRRCSSLSKTSSEWLEQGPRPREATQRAMDEFHRPVIAVALVRRRVRSLRLHQRPSVGPFFSPVRNQRSPCRRLFFCQQLSDAHPGAGDDPVARPAPAAPTTCRRPLLAVVLPAVLGVGRPFRVFNVERLEPPLRLCLDRWQVASLQQLLRRCNAACPG